MFISDWELCDPLWLSDWMLCDPLWLSDWMLCDPLWLSDWVLCDPLWLSDWVLCDPLWFSDWVLCDPLWLNDWVLCDPLWSTNMMIVYHSVLYVYALYYCGRCYENLYKKISLILPHKLEKFRNFTSEAPNWTCRRRQRGLHTINLASL